MIAVDAEIYPAGRRVNFKGFIGVVGMITRDGYQKLLAYAKVFLVDVTVNLAHQILRAQGKTNKEISKSLGISEKTVEKHLGEIFEKLHVASRVEAAVLALRQGLL